MSRKDRDPDRLYDDAALARFYDLANGWGPDFGFCAELARDVKSVLDLGCGTGQLAACLAPGRTVFGVDPACAMLDLARARPGGDAVTWVEGDARDVRIAQRFDLVVMTGHAFQVFLSDDDQAAVCATIAVHLAQGGRFIFDARNPATAEWRDWVPEKTQDMLVHPALGEVETWSDVSHDAATDIVTYETHYKIARGGEHFSAASKIRFTPRETIAAHLAAAGLAVDEWFGDWRGGTCTPAAPDFIPLGRLA